MRTRPSTQSHRRKFYPVNHNIAAQQLRVLDNEGKQIDILDKSEALKRAAVQGLDLVLIAESAKPPVAKIIDFKKFLYQEEKKERLAKKGLKRSSTKDIQLSLFIGPQDFKRFAGKARNFLTQGYQVRVRIPLRGREMAKKPMAFELATKFVSQIDNAHLTAEPKMQGRVLTAVLTRLKRSVAKVADTEHEKK